MNIADKLLQKIISLKNPTVVGLDPVLSKIPLCYKARDDNENPFKTVSDIIFRFNCDIIDTVFPYVPAVKPQLAFYEKYGSYGISAFEKTVNYAKEKGLVVIADAKRNDIGSTASAYSDAFLGTSETLDDNRLPVFDVDFLTVSPFLGIDGLTPFIDDCKKYNKGIFVLVKTSNPSSGEIQNACVQEGVNVSKSIAEYVSKNAVDYCGDCGYSPIGAVVGATYPSEASLLRQIMPHSIFLVPGYGAQGGCASDILPSFTPDGLGAVVNSSRGILYDHLSDAQRASCTRNEYLASVKNAVCIMQNNIYNALKNAYPNMEY